MAKSQPIIIGEVTFSKKGDALLHFKEMLNRYNINDRVSSSDSEFLKAALKNHPEYFDKVGVGIDHFLVRLADYGTRCFWIIRTDNTEEKFSYKSCV